MQKFETLTSNVIPLPVRDVDTDMIIPAIFMTSVSREGYGKNLFRRLRDDDAEFPFNLEQYQSCKILVADDNFGCGSSREHAVWALADWGIKAVIAKSFADIFSGNCGKNGLVLVKLPEAVVDSILENGSGGTYQVTIDLEKQEVTLPGGELHNFEFDPFRKHCILNGVGDIEYIQSHQEEIDTYRSKREQTVFFSALTGNR